MTRRITYEILKTFHKNGIKTLSNTGHCSKNLFHSTTKTVTSPIQKRFCHISNVTTEDDSTAINITKSSDLQSKILHTTVLQTNGKFINTWIYCIFILVLNLVYTRFSICDLE